MARGLKFRIYEVEGLYYQCSKNKGADKLHSYCTADLRLCFCMCKNSFAWHVSNEKYTSSTSLTDQLLSLEYTKHLLVIQMCVGID